MAVKMLCIVFMVALLVAGIQANVPSLPNEPVPSRYPLPYYPHQATPQRFNPSDHQVPSIPGHINYDNSANANRKSQTQPVPLGATPLNYGNQDIFPQQPLPSNPNIVPLGALPFNSESNPVDTNIFKPEDLSPVPIDTIGASPIPVKPNDNANDDSGDTIETIIFNPKDQSIDNIPASPIPIRPQNNPKTSKNTSPIPPEDLTPVPNDKVGASPVIPSKPDENNDEDSYDDKNTITINPQVLATEPIDSIESPIESSESGAETNDESAEEEYEESNASANNESSNNQNEPSENNEEPQNPLKDVILNGTPLSGNDPKSYNPLGDLILNGTSQGNPNTETSGEPENPLKDTLVNGTSSNDATDPEDNPLKDQIFNGSSSSEKEENESESSSQNSESNNGSSTEHDQSESQEVNHVTSENEYNPSNTEDQEAKEAQRCR